MTAPTTTRRQWQSTAEVAREYSRHESTVRRWCRDGTLLEFGFIVYRTTDKAWWIYNPR